MLASAAGAGHGETRAAAAAASTLAVRPLAPVRLALQEAMDGLPAWDPLPGLLRSFLAPTEPTANRDPLAGFDAPEASLHFRLSPDALPALALAVAPRPPRPAASPRPGSRRAFLQLPVWVQMAFGRWAVVGGYSVSPGADQRDAWHSGFALLRALSPRLSLVAQFSHNSADLIDAHANTMLGAGATYRLGGPFSLMLAGGPTIEHHGGTGMKAYAGLGIAF